MHFKYIDLMGFKSFFDKTRIALEPGISCVVGPNGSGKSNIADALRWVLGEQSSRSLRSGSMVDFIFSGSKNRKALGMAEVALTIDNSDGHLKTPFSEVAVGRRVYRSGQSEYMFNGSPCRLKDIQEVFVDSGISLDGITLISQGQISEIIAARPEDRRVIIEEAAGIVKYRNRKKEAAKKLAETRTNLERLVDIIAELEQRLVPLKSEAETAAVFLELSKEVRDAEIALARDLLKDLRVKIEQTDGSLENIGERILEKETARLSEEAKAEEVRFALAGMDEEIDRLQKLFYANQNEKERVAAQRTIVDSKIAMLTDSKNKISGETKEVEEKTRRLHGEMEKIDGEIDGLIGEIGVSEDELAHAAESRRVEGQDILILQEKVNKLKSEAASAAAKAADYKNRLHYEEQLKKNDELSRERMRAEIDKTEADLVLRRVNLERYQDDIKNARIKKEAAQKEMSEAQREFLEQSSGISEVSAEEATVRLNYNSLQSKTSLLEDMVSGYEGYFPGVKGVLLAKEQKKLMPDGVVDVFAALINVPKIYLTAVETYLGSRLQNIVCRTESSAKEAIRFLKQNNLGRATFLPLDTLNPSGDINIDRIAGERGLCGRAMDLIGFAPEFAKAVRYLLGFLVIAEDIDSATIIAGKLNYRSTVVTIEGDLINPGGSMTGGSRAKKSGDMLSRRSELESGKKKLIEMAKELAKTEETLRVKREGIRLLEERIDGLSALVQQSGNEIYALTKDAELAEGEIALLEKNAQALKSGDQNLLEAVAERETQIEELNMLAEESREEGDLLGAEADGMQTLLAEKQSKFSADNDDMTRYQIDLARRREIRSSLCKERERLDGECEQLQYRLKEKKSECAGLELDLSAAIDELKELTETETAMADRLLTDERGLNQSREGLAVQLTKLRDLESGIKAIAGEMETLQKDVYQHTIKRTRLDADFENEESKIIEKYGLRYDEISLLPAMGLSGKELRDKLTVLKTGIEELGNVNINAIEQYAEVKERFDFLTDQESDLREAEESLRKVIDDMEKVMKERFSQSFSRLNEEFNLSFQKLFRGGSASLRLDDPGNLLETGVDLVVSPPGKKVSNHNLLSGGEKSLVGLALMFALLAVRPTPFCVMDEVDAALDETNVERFTDYLKSLSAHTQFLLISHRQTTMEAAHSLWGVTMEEEGVSKLVSVRLQ